MYVFKWQFKSIRFVPTVKLERIFSVAHPRFRNILWIFTSVRVALRWSRGAILAVGGTGMVEICVLGKFCEPEAVASFPFGLAQRGIKRTKRHGNI